LPANIGFPINAIIGNGDNLWIAGDAGCVAYSSDFGNTWQLKVKYPAAYLYELSVSSTTMLAGGFTGAYVRLDMPVTKGDYTLSGGFVTINNKSPKINEIQVFDHGPNSVYYMARSNNLVCKSTDNGATWIGLTRDTSAITLAWNGLHFLDENTGFVAGKVENQLMKTTDGGASWIQLSPNAGVDLNDVYFTDINHGVVIGKNRTVKYTEDGGLTWNNAVLNNIPAGAPSTAELKRVTFVNSNVGYIAGALNFKTNDGGKSWDYLAIPDPTKTMNTVSVYNNSVCLVGANKVYESTDEGATWRDIVDTSVVKITSIYGSKYDLSGNVWISGAYSSIYTTNPLVNVDDPIANYSFNIQQNYPNPFNPSTKITYSLNNFGKVNLSVYNLLGQKVAELVNTEQAAGDYTVNFNADNLSSGVYFYTLKFDNVVKTKKMVLLK